MTNNENLVQSVDRAFTILEVLAENKNGCGVTNISKTTGLNKTTVHRLLNTMMIKGYIKKDLHRETYALGNKLLYLSKSLLDSIDLISIAKPYITKLANTTGDVVHLCILDNDKVVYIDKVENENPRRSIRMMSKVGKTAPIYCTASGKVLVSQFENKDIKTLLKNTEFLKHTENTILSIDDFLDEIHKVRMSGYGLDNIEFEQNIRCVSAPIYDRDNKIIAAISLSGVILQNEQDNFEELKNSIISTADNISYELGYTR